jgi:gas vesicle protein
MRKFSILVLAAVVLGLPAGALQAAPARSYETRQLKQQHKAQQKDLKEQQRAMKKVMGQHEMSDEQGSRFKHDLKMQKQMLRKSQKDDARRLKQNQKAAKAAEHATAE